MAFLSNTDSDSMLVVASMDSENDPRTKKDIGFEKDWFNTTVESEICRGNKLREKKTIPRYYESSAANIDFLGSFVKQYQKMRNKYSKNKTNPSSPKPRPPHRRRPTSADAAATYSAAHKYCIPSTQRARPKTSKKKKCPMRIAELAVPTKRQCIDTWRNKSDLLPEFMVERLKQHVLYQRPIVKIPEAIICFQRRSPSTSKTRCKSSENKRENYPDLSKPCRHMDSRTLCLLFAHRIAKRLSKQINLTLNADLQRLSKIIHGDIAKLLTKCTFSKDTKYRAIHTDVSNKITIWITSILDELSLKLLEEDLRVKLKNETNAQLSEQFVTLVETFLKEVRRKDLEEEEGPVLDFIDDLFDNVIDICEPPPVHIESESEESEKSETAKVSELVSDIRITTLEDIFNTEGAKNISDEDYLRKEIQNVIDNIRFDPADYFRHEISKIIDNINKISGDDTSNGSGEVADKYFDANTLTAGIESNNNNADLVDKAFDIKQSNKIVELPLNTEYFDKYKSSEDDEDFDGLNIDENVDEGVGGQNDDERVGGQNDDERVDNQNVNEDIVASNVGDENVNESVDESEPNDSNVSQHSEINILEDSDDEKDSQKVKFSHKDLVKSDDIAGQYKESVTMDEFAKYNQVQSSSTPDKSLIVFSAPNTYLLSDADESWPAALDAKLKISNSVSKSITSLGNIMEIDEIQKSPPKSVTTEKLDKPIRKLETESFLNKLNNIMSKEEYGTEIQSFNPIKESKETTAVEPKTIEINFKSRDTRDDKPDAVLEDDKLKGRIHEYSKNKKHELDSTESEILSTDSSFSGRGYRRVKKTSNKIPSYHKSSSLSDCGWRVQLHTAPSWVTSWGFGHGEPSDESIPKQIMPARVTEADMRKWCKDLEKAYINLEMWSHWIHNTCKETIYLLKQRKITCPGLARRHAIDWVKLKKNIHKDAVLWLKLYKRTETNFKDLKSKYNNVEFSPNNLTQSTVVKTIMETMCQIENMSVELHKMIVAAEYYAICTCDRNDRIKQRK